MAGFNFHYFRDLSEYRPIVLDRTIPLTAQEICVACAAKLRAVCIFRSKQEHSRVRLGYCESCGYLGYMDRPTREWVTSFYSEVWDAAQYRDAKKAAQKLKTRISPLQQHLIDLLKTVPIEKNRLVCDIGCGKGGVLKALADNGFTNSIGIENSRYRSEIVKEKYGFNMITGSFENPETVEKLRALAPVALFFSCHVLEHVYNPHEVLKVISELQQHGDYVLLAVPNANYEPLATMLFWLPHLHSFTTISLERMLQKYGYEIINENLEYTDSIVILARKTPSPCSRLNASPHSFLSILERLRSYFFFDRIIPDKRYCFAWSKQRKPNHGFSTGLKRVFPWKWLDIGQRFFENTFTFFAARWFKLPLKKRSFVMSASSEQLASRNAVLEIQFEKNIQLLIK